LKGTVGRSAAKGMRPSRSRHANLVSLSTVLRRQGKVFAGTANRHILGVKNPADTAHRCSGNASRVRCLQNTTALDRNMHVCRRFRPTIPPTGSWTWSRNGYWNPRDDQTAAAHSPTLLAGRKSVLICFPRRSAEQTQHGHAFANIKRTSSRCGGGPGRGGCARRAGAGEEMAHAG
jgi:hypothetical protein